MLIAQCWISKTKSTMLQNCKVESRTVKCRQKFKNWNEKCKHRISAGVEIDKLIISHRLFIDVVDVID